MTGPRGRVRPPGTASAGPPRCGPRSARSGVARARARLPPHHGIPSTASGGSRVRQRPRLVPGLGGHLADRTARSASTTAGLLHDYTPGYLYALWLGRRRRATRSGGIGDLIKLPAILSDVAWRWSSTVMLRDLGVRDGRARLAALVVLVNPITWFDSVDLGPGGLGRARVPAARRPGAVEGPATSGRRSSPSSRRSSSRSWASSCRSWRSSRSAGRCGRPAATATSRRPSRRGLGWERRTAGGIRILTTGLAGFLTAVVLSAPFGLSVIVAHGHVAVRRVGAVRARAQHGGGVLRTSPSTPTTRGRCSRSNGESTAAWRERRLGVRSRRRARGPGRDALGVEIGPVSRAAASRRWSCCCCGLLLVIVVPVLVARQARPADDPRRARGARARVLRRAHPRPRALPVPAGRARGDPRRVLLAVGDRVRRRERGDVPEHVRRPHHDLRRTTTTSATGWGSGRGAPRVLGRRDGRASLHTAVFLWALVQLRGRRAGRSREELAGACEPGGRGRRAPRARRDGLTTRRRARGGRCGGGRRPPPPRPPAGAAARARAAPVGAAAGGAAAGATLVRRCSRPGERAGLARDRARSAGSGAAWRRRPSGPTGPGCWTASAAAGFDRLDLWLLVVLVVAAHAACGRSGSPSPSQMHFDEVYHARTATEFLQLWRYGIDARRSTSGRTRTSRSTRWPAGSSLFAGHDVAASSS